MHVRAVVFSHGMYKKKPARKYHIAESCPGEFSIQRKLVLFDTELIKGMNAGVETDIAWMNVWCDRLPPVFVSRLL